MEINGCKMHLGNLGYGNLFALREFPVAKGNQVCSVVKP